MKKILPIIAVGIAGLLVAGCGNGIEKSEPNTIQTNIMEFREQINSCSKVSENLTTLALNKYKLSIISDELENLEVDDSNDNLNITSAINDKNKDLNEISENREIIKDNLRSLREDNTLNENETVAQINTLTELEEADSNGETDEELDEESDTTDDNSLDSADADDAELTETEKDKISTLYSLSTDIEESTSEFLALKNSLTEAINETQALIDKVKNKEIELSNEERLLITEQSKQLKELGRELSNSCTCLSVELSDLAEMMRADNIDIDSLNLKYMIVLDNLINGNEMLENGLNSINLINSMFNMNTPLPPHARGRVAYGFQRNDNEPIIKDYIIDENGNLEENTFDETSPESESNDELSAETENTTRLKSNVDTYKTNRFMSNIDTYTNENLHNIDSFFNTALLDNEFMYGNGGMGGYGNFGGYGGFNPYIMNQYANYENQNRFNGYNNLDYPNVNQNQFSAQNFNFAQNPDGRDDYENTTHGVDSNDNTPNKASKRFKLKKNVDTYRDENTPSVKNKFAKFKQSVKGFFGKLKPTSNDQVENPIYRFNKSNNKEIDN